ncbi:MAG TPA: molecular chaperone HtpG, partial [Anaerolineales bacterium]|nr:molecular chaperone HtpG [Anaerolineales bacterium]
MTAHETPIPPNQPIPFKAETRQLLDILIHSLYTEREIFLRELLSNAADALTRMDFELLTNRAVLDPDAELSIRILPDPQANTLTIQDTGVGMTTEELVENLGTIAHSGARAFLAAAQEGGLQKGGLQKGGLQKGGQNLTDIIGQFGVGFYSAFMVADKIDVISLSFPPDARPAAWSSSGADTFTVEPAEKAERGTRVVLHLKEDAREFTQESRLREIVRRHSDFVPFPIYIGGDPQQANRQTALWRQNPRQVDEPAYEAFYRQLTLDIEKPLAHAHMLVDAPVQLYALLYVPASPERSPFALRKEPGLKLYARKVLIQEFNRDLLPEYLQFIDGVVDSEDLPLNISRESIQSNRVLANLKRLVTTKVLDTLASLAKKDPDAYGSFWKAYGRFIKQGVAIEPEEPEALYPLLRFHTTAQPDAWSSLDDYAARMLPDQKSIYYLIGEDTRSTLFSPHLDLVRRYGYEVLLLTDPLDAFVLTRLNSYHDFPLANTASADLELPQGAPPGSEADDPQAGPDAAALVARFQSQLGDRVAGVRPSERLSDSPARLVDPEGALSQELQRVYRLLDKDFETPKKVLEINPRHPILAGLDRLPEGSPLASLVVEQIYENALLIEGLHPDPAGMIPRLQRLLELALTSSSGAG